MGKVLAKIKKFSNTKVGKVLTAPVKLVHKITHTGPIRKLELKIRKIVPPPYNAFVKAATFGNDLTAKTLNKAGIVGKTDGLGKTGKKQLLAAGVSAGSQTVSSVSPKVAAQAKAAQVKLETLAGKGDKKAGAALKIGKALLAAKRGDKKSLRKLQGLATEHAKRAVSGKVVANVALDGAREGPVRSLNYGKGSWLGKVKGTPKGNKPNKPTKASDGAAEGPVRLQDYGGGAWKEPRYQGKGKPVKGASAAKPGTGANQGVFEVKLPGGKTVMVPASRVK